MLPGHQLLENPTLFCKLKPALKKLISAAAFRLKGGGWYETDFKTGDRKNVAQADKQSKSDAKSKGKGNSDSTAAKKKTTGNN